MSSSLFSEDKLIILRQVTNSAVPDVRLRSALIRNGGDVNAAATDLLTSSTSAVALNKPLLVRNPAATQISRPSASRQTSAERPAVLSKALSTANTVPSVAPIAGQAKSNAKHATAQKGTGSSDLRRLAWRRFYLDRFQDAVAAVGPNVNSINRFIAEEWKQLGAGKRHEYAEQERQRLQRESANAQQKGQQHDQTGKHREDQAGHNEPFEMGDSTAKGSQSSPVTPEKTHARNGPTERPPDPKNSQVDDDEVVVDESIGSAKGEKRTLNPASTTVVQPTGGTAQDENQNLPHRVFDTTGDMETEQLRSTPHASKTNQQTTEVSVDEDAWPKKITSRLVSGNMLTSGLKLLTVNDELVLESPRAPRPSSATEPASTIGKNTPNAAKKTKKTSTKFFNKTKHRKPPQASSTPPSRIVRFSKNGRELGRLASDVGHALAPALQSGLVCATCRVVSAPDKLEMFSEVFLDISIFMHESAFADDGKDKLVEGGLSSGDQDPNVDSAATEGVDARTFNVVHLLTALKLCESPKRFDADFPLPSASAEGEVGEVSKENVEAYYRTVDAIQERDAEGFVQSKYLKCTLREYQRVGVSWMIAREKHGNMAQMRDSSSGDFLINPLWKKRQFPDGTAFYINPTTGRMSLNPPAGSGGGPYGGILADEMGLGKTVQCIACVVHDLEEQRAIEEEAAQDETSDSDDDVEIVEVKTAAVSPAPIQQRDKLAVVIEPGEGRSSDMESDASTRSPDENGYNTGERQESTVVGTRIGKSPDMKRIRTSAAPDSSDETPHSSQEQEQQAEDQDEDWAPCSAQVSDGDDFVEETETPSKRAKLRHGNDRPSKSALKMLMSKAHASKEAKGGTLIVCPTSVLTQWFNEFQRHVATGFLKAINHHGHMRGNSSSVSRDVADVVVTTYGVLSSEMPDDTDEDEPSKRKRGGGPLFQVKWRRVILDEAHVIRSRSTIVAKAAFKLQAERRWCVTGTVINNHINDVFSLIHFLRLNPWSSWAFWNRGIVNNLESKERSEQRTAMSLVRDLISAVTLRRKKTTTDSQGRAILQLTKKTVELVTLEQSSEERDFYSALHKRTKLQFDSFLAQGAAPSKDSALLKDKEKLYRTFLEGSSSSSQYIEAILKEAESGSLSDSRHCPLCMDVIDDAVAPRECGHPACRSCMDAMMRVSSHKCPICRVDITPDSITTLPRSSRFSMDLNAKWRSSAKIDRMLEEIRKRQELREESGKPIGKTVIFSQFTSMLDLVEFALKREKFSWLRLDGSVPQRKRALLLEQFDEDYELSPSTANILLVSLRAGGVGLNLVAASHAILLDIHWNPQVDAQAQDRIHRHGQTRDVVIKRYVIKDSVEDKLLLVQARKKDIADGALGVATDEDKNHARLSELKLLFSDT